MGVNGPLIYELKRRGELWYNSEGRFKTLLDGPVDPLLLERTKKRAKVKVPLTPLHLWMRDQLLHVTLDIDKKDIPVYFKAFLDLRDKQLTAFFTVDDFSGRVHTPVVNLKGDLRPSLRFFGEEMVSLDVRQMQPTILAKVLKANAGDNPFSKAIFEGEDVYCLLMKVASLNTRDEAKKFLFQLIFGKPMDDIGTMFSGDNKWVDWINKYKSNVEARNPHKEDRHTNLAWLLQFSEVSIMTEIWKRLKAMRIPFLSIHDDVLCLSKDKDRATGVMKRVLKKHFDHFTINVNHELL